MIPRKLELKNFLSYGEELQTIDLTPYALICLSGKNGNGKSAFLDAITWALWGQARKTSGTAKADEGLLHLGKTRMLVSLEWEIGNKIYRVRREYAKTYGKPYAALDFELYNPTDNRYISLTDKTIRQTQEVIEKTIGLDFETFVNSAFIRQGQSNEFSKKTPKDRKTILATILGLSRYDRLQQAALNKLRAREADKKLAQQLIAHHEQELAHQAELTQKQTDLQQALERSEQQLTVHHATIATYRTHQKTGTELCARYQVIAEQQSTLEQTKITKLLDLQEWLRAWRTTHAAHLRYANLTDLEEERTRLITQEQTMRTQQQELLTIESSLLTYQKQLLEHEQKLHQEELVSKQTLIVAYEKNILMQQQTALSLELLNKELTTATQEQQALQKRIHELTLHYADYKNFTELHQKAKSQFEKRKQFYHTLVQRGNNFNTELKELTHKQSITHNQQNPACPLCEQMLTAQRKKFLNNQFSKQEATLRHKLARIAKLIKILKQLLIDQHKELEVLEQRDSTYKKSHTVLQELAITEKQHHVAYTTLQATLKTQEELFTQLRDEEKKLALEQENAEKIAYLKRQTDPLIQDFLKKIADLTTTKKAFTYNPSAYAALQSHITSLTTRIQESATLKASLEQQPARKKIILTLLRDIREIKKQQANHIQDIEQHQLLVTQLNFLQQQIAHSLESINELTKVKDLQLQELGTCNNQLARLANLATEVVQKNKQVATLTEEIQEYQTLATAFSKNGIQALLIEEAIPEIEHEANALLAKLTDNQAQIFIESLRDLKSGGVRETLDIKIADTAGIRPYEMFSGGEAFRVDFALRIAISKLLARRAGTALQTLIIDEGFGSQDEEGLSRIMSALYAIQKDFSKIIIVSHLAEFKENFPVHFLIEKTATGSTITIEERG